MCLGSPPSVESVYTLSIKPTLLHPLPLLSAHSHSLRGRRLVSVDSSRQCLSRYALVSFQICKSMLSNTCTCTCLLHCVPLTFHDVNFYVRFAFYLVT